VLEKSEEFNEDEDQEEGSEDSVESIPHDPRLDVVDLSEENLSRLIKFIYIYRTQKDQKNIRAKMDSLCYLFRTEDFIECYIRASSFIQQTSTMGFMDSMFLSTIILECQAKLNDESKIANGDEVIRQIGPALEFHEKVDSLIQHVTKLRDSLMGFYTIGLAGCKQIFTLFDTFSHVVNNKNQIDRLIRIDFNNFRQSRKAIGAILLYRRKILFSAKLSLE